MITVNASDRVLGHAGGEEILLVRTERGSAGAGRAQPGGQGRAVVGGAVGGAVGGGVRSVGGRGRGGGGGGFVGGGRPGEEAVGADQHRADVAPVGVMR